MSFDFLCGLSVVDSLGVVGSIEFSGLAVVGSLALDEVVDLEFCGLKVDSFELFE